MSFAEWQKNGWVRPHQSSPQEVAALLAVIERDLETSDSEGLNDDWRFAIAYNAALQSASLALKASGFDVPKGSGAHHRTIESLKLTLADDDTTVELLQAFRAKRGGGIYESVGIASATEIKEVRNVAKLLYRRLAEWLKKVHPELVPPAGGKSKKPKRNS